MKRKRIVVMGFMGSMPIAGVIWQHIHYIVGLQRLGHDVYYIEDSARHPLQPANLRDEQRLRLRRASARAAGARVRFRSGAGVSARAIFPDNPTAGSSPNENPAALPRGGRDPQRLRHSGIQRRPAARASAFSTSRATRASSRSRSIKASARRSIISGSTARFSPSAKTSGPIGFPCRCTN